ncbi:MAG: hypothetical protein L0Z62_00640 [Gemmataceae bacterium]|nr:hypothetical protein [Gemmataceae bacterium]
MKRSHWSLLAFLSLFVGLFIVVDRFSPAVEFDQFGLAHSRGLWPGSLLAGPGRCLY